MAKQLKLWNGHAGSLNWQKYRDHNVYIAAYSRADLRRLCVEAGLNDPGENEVKNYWSEGCWGISMEGITPERGIWIQSRRDHKSKPERIF